MKKYLFLFTFLFFVPLAADAACPSGTSTVNGACVPTTGKTGLSNKSVKDVIVSVTKFVTAIIGSLSILMIVVSGVWYMTSAGDQTRVDTAKKVLTYSIVGLVIALLAFSIVVVISGALT